jgi:hypothetical protein
VTVRIPRALVVALVAVLLIGGAGVGAFLLGRSTGRNSINQRSIRAAAYNHGYGAGYLTGNQAGYLAGNQSGLAQGRTEGQQTGYTNGYNAAVKKANGGLPSAYDDAFSQGGNAVFSGLPAFNIGSYYIVKIAPGQAVGHGYSINYGLASSLEMKPGQSYNMCPNSTGICGGNLP